MAADMGLSAAKYILESGVNTILYYRSLISEAKKELDHLSNELKTMISFVDTYSNPNNTPFFKEWVKQIRDVILEVEDTVISCAIQAESEKNSKFFSRVLKSKRKIGLAEQVKELRVEKVKPVLDPIKNGYLNQPNANTSQAPTSSNTTGETRDERKKDPRQENVILLKVETKNLVDDLTSEKQERQVFAIVGMPGLGKTTLAWHIHHHKEIKENYPDNIWVNVSQEFNKNDVLRTIVAELKKKDSNFVVSDKASTQELSDIVHEKLKTGNFLIIFDDVWTTDVWKEIKIFLPLARNKQCKVLITTRHHEVVRYATERQVENLRYLEDDESWDLLELEVFGKKSLCPKELEPWGIKIAKLCSGLPLAIVVIGGVLHGIWSTAIRNMDAKEEWEVVSNRMEDYLIDGNAAADGSKDDKILTSVISTSYYGLRNELKDCFLYLGMFPEDTEIPVRKLTWLWIAEGFIHPEKGKSLEKTAQDYVKHLIDKNLLKVERAKPDGKVKSCRVHDWIRNFCKNKAADYLFQEIIRNSGKFEPDVDNIQECRRISIHSSLREFLQKTPESLKVRSFLSFSKEIIVWDDEKDEMPSIKKTFNFLRVLDVHMAINFPKFPNDLTQLVLLKYITLSGDEFKDVPKDMYKLWNVETLEVYTLSPTLKVNAEIWKMRRLRHFKTNASIILSKQQQQLHIFSKDKGKGDAGGENLVTLSRLSPESCTSQVFMSNAKTLKELCISGDLRKLLLVNSSSCLRNLEYLEKMKLLNGLSRAEASRNPMGGVPRLEWFPKNLKILSFSGTRLVWNEHMSTLALIPTLQVLKLKDNAFVGGLWIVRDSGFSRLVSLHISDTDLVAWNCKDNAFPELKDLVLKNCKQLTGIPTHFTKLEILHLDSVSKSAVSSAKDLEKEISKLNELDANKTAKRGEFKLVILPREDDLTNRMLQLD